LKAPSDTFSLSEKEKIFNTKSTVTHKRSAAVAKKLARQKSKPKLLQGFIGPKSCLGLSEQVCMDETSYNFAFKISKQFIAS